MQRHRHVEFIRFLNTVEREVAADKSIHVVLDNYATHKHPKVLAWLARHPRWIFHFTPTSASWLNAVENFFSKMTRQRIRRGVFRSVVDLQAAINAYLAEHNANPKPFVWTKSAEAILAKLDRCPVLSVWVSALVCSDKSSSMCYQNRYFRRAQNPFGEATENPLAQPAMAVAAHHQ
jgi:transposase